jgi:mannosyl-oligosaccharide alpha-1,2-mannosidase
VSKETINIQLNSFCRNGWGASAVDALSTAIVMGEAAIVEDIVKHISTIDFSKTNSAVSLFETTIRYLGGMISGYDFLGPGGPQSSLLRNSVSEPSIYYTY